MLKKITKHASSLLLFLPCSFFLAACSGGDSGSSSGVATTGALSLEYKGSTYPISGVNYTTDSSRGTTTADGKFDSTKGENISFSIAGATYTVPAKENMTQQDLAGGDADTASNLAQLLRYSDHNQWTGDGIEYADPGVALDATLPTTEFIKQFYLATGDMPPALFAPSLGINLEAPQGEADTAGQPMPFVDLFRTARPFIDRNDDRVSVTVDQNGWPIAVSGQDLAQTKMLQGVPRGAIPDGDYILLFAGNAGFGSSPAIESIGPYTASNGLSGRLVKVAMKAGESNEMSLVVSPGTSRISFVMPGGTCRNASGKYNHFVRVEGQHECPTGTTFVSFVDRISANRNEIIFNPEYLSFLKDFKTLRMMNFMEASPSDAACTRVDGSIDDTCVLQQTRPWEERALMNHAVWGGSARTPEQFRNGVPVEVLAELANQTGADPWFVMPHNVDDFYITQFASAMNNLLAGGLNAYIEYTNEAWNSGFMAHHYVQLKGIAAGLDTVPGAYVGFRDENYFARLRYYSRRAVEIFIIWDRVFSDPGRLTHVLGSSQGDTVLTREILNFENAKATADAAAIAPYFFGCSRRSACPNAPMTLAEVTTVDDVFTVIDQKRVDESGNNIDSNALEATLYNIQRQAAETYAAGVALLAYEGGQHLTTTLGGDVGALSLAEKERLRGLFQAANRDQRMKNRYLKLLKGWKSNRDQGTALFTLYTLPQTYYEYGNWGIKEHLGKTRAESPKYNAAMEFQEAEGQCWWAGC